MVGTVRSARQGEYVIRAGVGDCRLGGAQSQAVLQSILCTYLRVYILLGPVDVLRNMTINEGPVNLANGSQVVTDAPPEKVTDEASWEVLAAKKRAALLASIPAEWRIPGELLPPESQLDVTKWPETSGWFTPEELAITECDASHLISKLSSGELKSEEVTKAFCKRACAAHQLVLDSDHSAMEGTFTNILD